MRPGHMNNSGLSRTVQPARPRSLLVQRIVATAFMLGVTVLGVASWDVASGRVPETSSPLLLAVLNDAENRTCTRDLPTLAARFFPAGMSEGEARALLTAAIVTPPRPWFWRAKSDDAITATPDGFSFVRTLRYTPFGNHQVSGVLGFQGGVITSSRLTVRCALG